MSYARSICWIRRDLRLHDHVALAAATAQSEQVAVVFVFDPLILDALEDRDDRRVTFIHHSLRELDRKLRDHGSRLIVLHGDPVHEIPNLCRTLEVDALFFNGDVEPYALERDQAVRQTVTAKVHVSKDHVIFARREVLSQTEQPFRVYTPYSKAWKAKLTPQDLLDHAPDPTKFWRSDQLESLPTLPSLESLDFEENTLLIPAGSDAARQRLEEFKTRMSRYASDRDRFDIDGTSMLSVHLRHGTLSIRECVRAAMEPGGSEKWLNELIWRDFYQMILSEFPHVVDGAFKPELDAIEWPGTDEHFRLWCEGKTGYPVVDAAMRCFNATGWMHNRLRMVVAMFLTKDLLVDWRKGEAYFARKLLDFDLASNNGGWQWSASTGVDSQPYFRIFNPFLQSVKFDPEATFIAEWCPELAGFPVPLRHWPHDATLFDQETAGCVLGRDYPAPIVNHHEQKEKAMALFKVQAEG